MTRTTEFKLKAVVVSTGEVVEGFHPCPDYDDLVREGYSDQEIKATVMNEWIATQFDLLECKRV